MLDQLLDALGYAGSALNKPGRAVRGLLAGKGREGLAAIPFSDSLGLTDEADETSGKDLLKGLGLDPGEGLGGTLAGMGAEVATDPLTFAGGALGRLLGKSADAAQVARGPRYGTTAEDLIGMAKGAPEFNTPLMQGATPPSGVRSLGIGSDDMTVAGQKVRDILKSPNAARILSEIPEGSSMLGTGAEAVALKTPAGDVLRIGRELGGKGRPASEFVAPSTRAVDIPSGGKGVFRAERTPFAENAGNDAFWNEAAGDGHSRLSELMAKMEGKGLALGDDHAGNVGMLGGKPVAIDPGAVDVLDHYAGGYHPVGQAGEPGLLMRMLLSSAGGDEALQRSLAAGGNDPGLARKLMGYGAAEGAAAGVASRSKR